MSGDAPPPKTSTNTYFKLVDIQIPLRIFLQMLRRDKLYFLSHRNQVNFFLFYIEC